MDPSSDIAVRAFAHLERLLTGTEEGAEAKDPEAVARAIRRYAENNSIHPEQAEALESLMRERAQQMGLRALPEVPGTPE